MNNQKLKKMHLKIKSKGDLYKYIEEEILDTRHSSYDELLESIEVLKKGGFGSIDGSFDLELQDISRRLVIGVNENVDLDVMSDNIRSLMVVSMVRLSIKNHNQTIEKIDDLLSKF